MIERVGDAPTPTIEQAQLAIVEELLGDGIIELEVTGSDGRERSVALDVRGRIGELTAPDALFDGLGIVMGPIPPAVIGGVQAGAPASEAGLREGDRIVAVDGQAATNWMVFADYVEAHPGQPVALDIDRNGVRLNISAVPAATREDGRTVGRLGVWNAEDPRIEGVRTERHYGPIEALGVASTETWDMSLLTVHFLWRMITGDVSLKNASGPVMIAAYAGDFIQAGLSRFLRFLAVISISLGIMNLLPVPILDGGQIVLCLVEGVKGSPLSQRTAVIGQQIGLAMLVLLMGFVFYNDITRLLGQ
jgi:regulator of sigma E protease